MRGLEIEPTYRAYRERTGPADDNVSVADRGHTNDASIMLLPLIHSCSHLNVPVKSDTIAGRIRRLSQRMALP
ncbi:hypothetical protein DFQ27_001051 [Actinomortierella ambigua]|uniref:Uncharacterized protein n=1 Tax=Actinomortierella ambigua TaxID=1343610 RepID=A0A9P6TVE9_9FUNG|nr:hypothetical protein DFQ27_001051 [Actinomortierella ambigua]